MSDDERLVFILGVSTRSGTNYLRDLIVQHPDTSDGRLGEDYLLYHASSLAWTPMTAQSTMRMRAQAQIS